MKFFRIFIVVCLALPVKLTAFAASNLAENILISDVTVLSAHLGQPQHHMDVLLENGRIRSVLETGTNPRAGVRIDGRGKFLISGLIDSHVHLAHNPFVNRADRSEFEALHRSYRKQLPRSLLYYGFTSVIDLDYAPDRNGWLPESEHVPHVYHCGRGVRNAGGYGPNFVPPEFVSRAFPNLVFEQRHGEFWPADMAPELYTVEAAVERVFESGAICLKTYVEPGFGGVFDLATPSMETLSALGAGAHQNGLVFIIHANSADSWQAAVSAGADVIAHGLWHWDGDRRFAELSQSAISAIKAVAAAGVAVQPTMQVVAGEKRSLTWDVPRKDWIAPILTKDMADYLQSFKGQWSRRALLGLYRVHNPFHNVSPAELIDVSVARSMNSTMRFYQSGGRLLMGSDTPAQDGVGNLPGLNGYLEMVGWDAAGIPLDEIFAAVTLNNARAFGIDDELGSIESGKQADLLLLNSDPLTQVEAYNDIALVILDGEVIARGDLSAQ